MGSTIRDVARAAGVSASTVSRALSEGGSVSGETRSRVIAAAERLDYRPNPTARGLITGRTGNLGLIVPDLLNPFFADVAKGLQSRARATGLSVFVADADEDPRLELEAVQSLTRQVDGLVLCSPRSDVAELVRHAATPVVLIHRRHPGLSSVTADVSGGTVKAVQNLRALGHTTIAYVDGPAASWVGGQRREGLREAVQATGVEVIHLGNFAGTFDGGFAAADLMLASPATAVLAYNDIVACGLLNRLAARGVRVPDDVSVVGYDDVTIAMMTYPPLTTVHLPRQSAARAAVDLLVAAIRDPDVAPREDVLATHLVVRASTGVPARR